jgi:hypothetical protein
MVHADPLLVHYVRHIKLTADDQKAKMRKAAVPLLAAQVRH